jgi:hypothetical protein
VFPADIRLLHSGFGFLQDSDDLFFAKSFSLHGEFPVLLLYENSLSLWTVFLVGGQRRHATRGPNNITRKMPPDQNAQTHASWEIKQTSESCRLGMVTTRGYRTVSIIRGKREYLKQLYELTEAFQTL